MDIRGASVRRSEDRAAGLRVTTLDILGLLVIEPRLFRDARGFFLETWNAQRYAAAGVPCQFVQDNLSFSTRGILRGLHFQQPMPQAKLVSVLHGEVFDVAVDIRHGSPTFGRWAGVPLSGETQRQFFIPEGFAHGFCVLSETALFSYKCSAYYAPQFEQSLHWADPGLGVEWPIDDPVLSAKDNAGLRLEDFPAERLPCYAP